MGNVFSISFDIPVSPFLRYLCCNNLESNLDGLQIIMSDLNARRDDLCRWVSIEEDRGLQVLPVVKQWISKAEDIESKVNRLLDLGMIEIEKLSMYGYCPLISASRYEYSKKVDMMLTQVESLLIIGTFEAVSDSPMEMRLAPQPTSFQEKLLESAWARLMDENVGTLGIYGMGGVGKTFLSSLLLNQITINNFSGEAFGFGCVIWVVVSREVEKLQDEIGRRLGLQWEQETKKEKAAEIFRVLTRQRFILLLDDIQREVDLEEIGVPYPTRDNGCKIVFTTRDRGAFGRKWVDVEFFKVNCLLPQDAWDLFQMKVGLYTLTSDPDIPALARITAEKCHGLPLALSVVGATMSSKRTVQEWRYAINILNSNTAQFGGFEDKILPTLKFSYDTLPGEKLKSCFLYCALFPEGFVIRRQDLVNYWVGEGLISNEFEGYDTISHLVMACLLMEDESGVKMEPNVREMALWVASRKEEHFVVFAGMGLCEMPMVRDWRMVRRMSVTSNQIESISDSPECTQLTTLLLRDNKIKSINGNFFRSMLSLLVLDLSHNRELSELPEEISMLVSLRYLSLLGTRIKELPHGLGELVKLIHLDLESTPNLGSIGMISGLRNLQVLKFYGSKASLDVSLLEHLKRLRDLQLLTVTVREVGVLKAFLGSSLAGRTQGLYLEGLEVSVTSFAATFGALGNLRNLKMIKCDIIESETKLVGNGSNPDSPSTSSNPITSWFENLSDVVLISCEGLRDLTWLIHARSLESLSITLSPNLEEIISEKKGRAVVVDEPFLKLQVLDLDYLDKLKSIYWSPLSFPRLKKVNIKNCSNLHKLPLNSTSVAMIDDLDMEVEKEWLERVEWENGAKERFLRVIRTVYVSQLHPV